MKKLLPILGFLVVGFIPTITFAEGKLVNGYLIKPKENLSGAMLINANLSGTNLKESNLSGSNLMGANLNGANLEFVDLKNSILIAASLINSNLKGADLRYAALPGANLRNANLSGADLRYSALAAAYLDNVNFSGADLRYTSLRDVEFKNVNLKGVIATDLIDCPKSLPKGWICENNSLKETNNDNSRTKLSSDSQETLESKMSVIDLASFYNGERFTKDYGIDQNTSKIYEPVFGVKIYKETLISNLHRKDDQITMYGPQNSITKIVPGAMQSKNITVLYMIPKKKGRQKYLKGEFHLNYQWFLILDNQPVLGGLQDVALNCKTNEYYRNGMRRSEKFQVEEETTFGIWARYICDGKSDFFKKLRRGYSFY